MTPFRGHTKHRGTEEHSREVFTKAITYCLSSEKCLQGMDIQTIFSDAGSVFSLAGFAVSAWVLVKVRGLESHFLSVARSSELGAQIREHSQSIVSCLNDFERNRNAAAQESVRAEVTLRHLARILPRNSEEKSSVRAALESVRQYNAQKQDEKALRDVYHHLIRVEEEIKNYQEAAKWTRT